MATVLSHHPSPITQHPFRQEFPPSKGWFLPTEVVFWGCPSCGKTSAICALLSLEGMSIDAANPSPLTTTTQHPSPTTSLNSSQSLYVNAIHKPAWWTPRRPFTFVEVPLTGKTLPDVDLNRQLSQVHLLCIDCRQDLDMQVGRLTPVLRHLSFERYLDVTSALRILIMKADLLNTPEGFRQDCAQSLVTAQLPRFWSDVQASLLRHGMLKPAEVRKALWQPIAFSAGEAADVPDASPSGIPFIPDSQSAQHLFQDVIRPRCLRRQWW